MTSNRNTPWTLTFDQDGTEDIGNILDAEGRLLVASRPFWMPEGDDPIPPTLAALRLMAAAPKLLDALDYLLEQTVDMDRKHGIGLSEGEEDARAKALEAVAVATEGCNLPPDPESMNHERAAWAALAVDAFQEATGTDDEDVLGDLLCDLRHWADRRGYDFGAASVRAGGHYEAETAETER